MRLFAPAEGDALQQRVLDWAHADDRVVAGAAIGSLALGGGDRWSDLDLTLAVADTVEPRQLLDDWTIKRPPLILPSRGYGVRDVRLCRSHFHISSARGRHRNEMEQHHESYPELTLVPGRPPPKPAQNPFGEQLAPPHRNPYTPILLALRLGTGIRQLLEEDR